MTINETKIYKSRHLLVLRFGVYMEIKEPDGSSLYAGNGKSVREFTANILESGTYSIYVEACHAKGTVYIQQKGEKKDAR